MLTIPRRGLVLDLPLNWDAKDYSWNWHDGTPTDVAWVETNIGYQSKCASFNGSSSYVVSPLQLYNSSFTISMFVKKNTWTTKMYFYSSKATYRSDYRHLWLYIDWGNWLFIYRSYMINWTWSSWGAAIKKIDISKWYHIVCQFDWSNLKVFVNWNLSYIEPISKYNLNNIVLWYSNIHNDYYFNWSIILFRIHNRVLTEPEIRTLYLEWLRKLTSARNTYL